jgi:EAL domain-containing protein (putative c-di-GMP-specific phosphodiesterase class I)
MVLAKVARNLNRGGKPHIVRMATNIAQRTLKGFDAMGLGHQISMKGNAHHRAALVPFFEQLIKMAHQNIGVALRAHRQGAIGDHVIDLQRIGHGHEFAGLGLKRLGLIILKEIARIPKVIFGDQIECADCMGQCGRQIAPDTLTCGGLYGFDRILNDGALLGFVHFIGIARIINPVGKKLPVARHTGLDDFRAMIAHRNIERNRTPQTMAIQQFHQAQMTHTIAPIALRITHNIGRGLGPARTFRVHGRHELIIFNVGRNPKRELFAPRPHNLRAPDIGPVVVQIWVGLHRFLVKGRGALVNTFWDYTAPPAQNLCPGQNKSSPRQEIASPLVPMSITPAQISKLFAAQSLAENALILLHACGCEIDERGGLAWVNGPEAAKLLGVDEPPETLREMDAITGGAASKALGSRHPVQIATISGLEIRGDSLQGIFVLSPSAASPQHGSMPPNLPDPANDPSATMLIKALAEKRMCLFRQPIVNATDASIVRWECLSRLICEDGRIIPPSEFIPAAERIGVVSALDLDTLDLALGALGRNPTTMLAVNVSAATIADIGSRRAYKDRLSSSPDFAKRLTIEITETIAIQDLDIAARFGHAAKAAGARLALDDFGEGHTSFQSLRTLPLDEVKIDGLYIENIDSSTENKAFVVAIDRLARDLGMETVAERVETAREADVLRDIGVHGLQGYYYGRPRSVAG